MDLRFFVAHFHFMEKERSYYERIGFRYWKHWESNKKILYPMCYKHGSTEEQKMILNCYEGGKTKVIREMHRSMEELESTGEDPEMFELLADLVVQIESCTNKNFFS